MWFKDGAFRGGHCMCEMSITDIHKKMSMQYSWSNVNLCRTPSDKQQWHKLHFFLNLFDRNIILSYLKSVEILPNT